MEKKKKEDTKVEGRGIFFGVGSRKSGREYFGLGIGSRYTIHVLETVKE